LSSSKRPKQSLFVILRFVVLHDYRLHVKYVVIRRYYNMLSSSATDVPISRLGTRDRWSLARSHRWCKRLRARICRWTNTFKDMRCLSVGRSIFVTKPDWRQKASPVSSTGAVRETTVN